MTRYIINKNKQPLESGGNHEVHDELSCSHLPLLENRIYLGYFDNCKDAINYAKQQYPNAKNSIDGCYYCTSCSKS